MPMDSNSILSLVVGTGTQVRRYAGTHGAGGRGRNGRGGACAVRAWCGCAAGARTYRQATTRCCCSAQQGIAGVDLNGWVTEEAVVVAVG